MKTKTIFLFLILLPLFFLACARTEEEKIAVIWTNKADFVSYCEVFNNSQDKYKVIVEYKENPADAIINTEYPPDIVIGPWLKGKAAIGKFKKINNLFDSEKIEKTNFYPELLNLGSVSGNQYLLPVSFNLPMIIFSSAMKSQIKEGFTISTDEMREASLVFNKSNKGSYSRMGFSPRWFDDFLYITAKGFHASFEEENTFFTWNDRALQSAISYIINWSKEVNSSARIEDEFKFKYLYDSPYSLVRNGRCLFYYVSSDELFSTPQKQLENIDFRWLNFNGKTPLDDAVLYAGICDNAKNKKAAEAFFIWFFNEDIQKQLLDRSHQMNLMVSSFALAGGFSGIRQVTEKLLPRYYPLLLSHLPQTETFYAPHILPSNWIKLKKEIVIPYLKEACEAENGISAVPSLSKKITDWYKNQ